MPHALPPTSPVAARAVSRADGASEDRSTHGSAPADAVPRVAFALPVYNGAEYLEEALDSLRAQTEARWVAVLTDNASTDATLEIARAAAQADPRIRVVRNASNLGANGNFNRSMALAIETGAPFVKWAAHDDVLRPGYLAACLDALAARPEAVGAHTAYTLVDDDGEPYPYDPEAGGFLAAADDVWPWLPDDGPALAGPDPGERLLRMLRGKLSQSIVYGVFRAEAIRQVRPFAMLGVEDALCAELLLRGPLAFVDQVLFEQRLHRRSARHLSRRDYIAYETGERPTRARLPSIGRAAEFARAVAGAPLGAVEKARAWAALGRFALGTERIKNLVVPGPNNYFGIGTDR